MDGRGRAGRCLHDECTALGAFAVYAAYPVEAPGEVHSRVGHYPAAMHRACAAHVGAWFVHDSALPGATKVYVVLPVLPGETPRCAGRLAVAHEPVLMVDRVCPVCGETA